MRKRSELVITCHWVAVWFFVLSILLLAGSTVSAQEKDKEKKDPPAAKAPTATAPTLPTAPPTAPTTPATPPSTSKLTAESVVATIKQLEADTEIEEGLKAKLIAAYRLAEAQLVSVATFQQRAAAIKQQVETAPQTTEQYAKQLEQLPALTEAKAAELPELKAEDPAQQLAKAQADFTTIKTKMTALEAELKDLAVRPSKAREELAAAKTKLEQIEKELKAPAPPDEPEPLTTARHATLEARQRARTAEIASLEQELVGHDARLALKTAERNLTARRLANMEVWIKVLQAEVNRLKREEAEKARLAAEQAQRDAIGKHPAIRELADENAKLSKQLTEVVEREQATSEEQTNTAEQLKSLQKQFDDAKKKIEVAGLSETLGRILRDQRNSLPNIKRYQRNAAERSELLAEVGLDQFEIDDQVRKMSDVEVMVEQRMATIEATVDSANRQDIEAELRKLITVRKELLDKLGPAYSSYVNALGELDFQQKQLIDKAGEYATFLDERLLWIPSTKPISGSTFSRMIEDVKWLILPENWAAVVHSLRTRVVVELFSTLLTVLVFMALLFSRRWMRRKVDGFAEFVGKAKTDSFRWTVIALVVTLLVSAPWPLLIGFIGRLLRDDFTATLYVRGFGEGMVVAAMLLFPILAMAGFCAKKGVACCHLRWSDKAAAVMRRNLLWLRFVAPSLAFLIAFTDWQSDDSHQSGLGRVAFMAVMFALAYFILRVLNPRRGAVAAAIESNPNGMLARTRLLWYIIAVGTPIVLAGLAAIGYFYTAQQLDYRLLLTVYIILIAIILDDLVLRGLMLARVRLALKQAAEKRAAAKAARKAEEEGELEEAMPIEEPAIDLAAVNEQTRQLIRAMIGVSLFVALWGVWSSVLPALGILDQITLWDHSAIVAGQPTIVPITLKNVGLAILALILTFLAARNLPGAMDMIVLGRLPIDAGTRYAISTISRYVIVGTGIALAFGMIGIGWSQVQWLLAALTVGLGFGLQEIFANFVSGIIILVERPVRVGDTVTVGTTSGIVSRIRIRATTITDWNRKELIVPNKRFITEEVINWTLSDPVTRLDILVGIAYGSDTALALKTMQETVKKVTGVIEAPEPEVFFLGFGDNTLNFEVRVYVREMTNKNRTKVIHGVHMAIDLAFREKGIVIAFPQRDLHIKSSDVPINIIAQMQTGNGGAVPPPAKA